MKALVRVVVLVGAAAAVSIALSSVARADVVEPRSAYQPTSVGMLSKEAAAAAMPASADPQAKTDPKAKKDATDKPAAQPKADAAPATPAPEHQVIRQIPAPVADRAAAPSVVHRLMDPFRVGLERIGASLGRVASACDVGLATGPGGPVLVLAVLSMAAPFVRRRISAVRRVADEDVPEFLFAWESTPPG